MSTRDTRAQARFPALPVPIAQADVHRAPPRTSVVPAALISSRATQAPTFVRVRVEVRVEPPGRPRDRPPTRQLVILGPRIESKSPPTPPVVQELPKSEEVELGEDPVAGEIPDGIRPPPDFPAAEYPARYGLLVSQCGVE